MEAMSTTPAKAPETLDDFTRAYIEAALWSSTISREPEEENYDTPFEDVYSVDDIAQESMDKIVADCERLQKENEENLAKAYELYVPRDGYEGASLAGHDFWLTRNGHGVGFWDRNLGEVGDALTEAAKCFKGCDIYVGDDGRVYFQ